MCLGNRIVDVSGKSTSSNSNLSNTLISSGYQNAPNPEASWNAREGKGRSWHPSVPTSLSCPRAPWPPMADQGGQATVQSPTGWGSWGRSPEVRSGGLSGLTGAGQGLTKSLPRQHAATGSCWRLCLSQPFHLDLSTNYCFQLPPVYSFPCNLLM